MLFNSYEFIFAFLPITVIVFYALCGRVNVKAALGWLVVASLFFYGWWNPTYLALLVPSILINYGLGLILVTRAGTQVGYALMLSGVAFNLGLIGYYKYAGFLASLVSPELAARWDLAAIILPLGISFFTFQQISFLVDCYRGLGQERSLRNYFLFVSFFPQLIAGPIVHHSEMMPQFNALKPFNQVSRNIAIGLSIFAIGLFKKAVLADGIAVYATPVFADADSGGAPGFFQAWGGALAYTFQLYFDFSGYCDMAIGAARMFGIRLPLNFHSPYKATSIIDFWRRWHMTLSRFLRDYIYIPLGGNRQGPTRRHLNLMMTMLIGGLWHGAGWTFVIWGGLHGTYLIINHAWRQLTKGRRAQTLRTAMILRWVSWGVTFFAVVVAWVLFRAITLDGAVSMLSGMAGLNGVSLPLALAPLVGDLRSPLESAGIVFEPGNGRVFVLTYLWVSALMLLAIFAPNTQELMRRYRPALIMVHDDDAPDQRPVARGLALAWRPTPYALSLVAIVFAGGILALPQVSEFLYFQF